MKYTAEELTEIGKKYGQLPEVSLPRQMAVVAAAMFIYEEVGPDADKVRTALLDLEKHGMFMFDK